MDSSTIDYSLKRNCTPCSYPNNSCNACPITVNYWTSLPQGFITYASGTSSITEERIRKIIKEEIEASKQSVPQKNCGIVGTIEIEANLDSFKKAAEYFDSENKTNKLTFEDALTALKAGKRVTNKKWNGDNQYIFMMPGYESVPANETLSKASGIHVGSDVCIAPYLMMRNAQGIYSNWVPSNGDLFSESWKIIE